MTVLPNWSFASNENGEHEEAEREREAETAIFPSKQLNNLRFPATRDRKKREGGERERERGKRERERERERVDKRQHQYLLVKSNLPTTTDGSINNPRDSAQTDKTGGRAE